MVRYNRLQLHVWIAATSLAALANAVMVDTMVVSRAGASEAGVPKAEATVDALGAVGAAAVRPVYLNDDQEDENRMEHRVNLTSSPALLDRNNVCMTFNISHEVFVDTAEIYDDDEDAEDNEDGDDEDKEDPDEEEEEDDSETNGEEAEMEDDEESYRDDEAEYEQDVALDDGIDEEQEGPGAKFGVLQVMLRSEINSDDKDIFNETAVQETLDATETYMAEIRADPFYLPVRYLCYNKDPLCTAWAAHGECEEYSEFMVEVCGPACQTCDLLHYETRCPIDDSLLETNVWKSGDVTKMFEQLLPSDMRDKVQVLSRPKQAQNEEQPSDGVVDGPWVVMIDDFLNEDETQRMIVLGEMIGFERSQVSGGINEETGEAEDNLEDEDITSSTAWCTDECSEDEVAAGIVDRITKLSGIPTENSEYMQLVKYEIGEFYLTHHDYVEHEEWMYSGGRILTALMYFNNVEHGGETYFDQLDLTVQPKRGRLLLFANVFDEDPNQRDDRLTHEALPVVASNEGQQELKYVANLWMHMRDMDKAAEMGCD